MDEKFFVWTQVWLNLVISRIAMRLLWNILMITLGSLVSYWRRIVYLNNLLMNKVNYW